jgi:hypothetical protein
MKKGRNCSKFINQRILNHLTHQLKKNTWTTFYWNCSNHSFSSRNNIETNVYLEDWVMECALNMCLNI